MAAIAPTTSTPASGVRVISWTPVTEADTAAPIAFNGSESAMIGFQVFGTFGGATATLQGSNDGTNWVTLTDMTGSALGHTSAGGADFTASFLYFRPSFSGGTGQSLSVLLATKG